MKGETKAPEPQGFCQAWPSNLLLRISFTVKPEFKHPSRSVLSPHSMQQVHPHWQKPPYGNVRAGRTIPSHQHQVLPHLRLLLLAMEFSTATEKHRMEIPCKAEQSPRDWLLTPSEPFNGAGTTQQQGCLRGCSPPPHANHPNLWLWICSRISALAMTSLTADGNCQVTPQALTALKGGTDQPCAPRTVTTSRAGDSESSRLLPLRSWHLQNISVRLITAEAQRQSRSRGSTKHCTSGPLGSSYLGDITKKRGQRDMQQGQDRCEVKRLRAAGGR